MMLDPTKLSEDILQAIEEIETFCRGKTFADFRKDRGLQLIIERELEIIGEALARLRRDHPDSASRIRDIDKIIGLRNVLAHGDDVLEHEILWDVVENKTGTLKQNVQGLA